MLLRLLLTRLGLFLWHLAQRVSEHSCPVDGRWRTTALEVAHSSPRCEAQHVGYVSDDDEEVKISGDDDA